MKIVLTASRTRWGLRGVWIIAKNIRVLFWPEWIWAPSLNKYGFIAYIA